jgi:arylsulfatase A-like enzyme
VKAERPNILIYMTDQEQAQVSFPEHPCQMPHTEQLARDGVLFRNCHTVAAHCCPTRARFMTGLYPSRHGVYNNVKTHTAIHKGLNEGVVTFSELIRESGYRMAYSGKWHVTNLENPSDRGWEELHVTAPGDGEIGDRGASRWKGAGAGVPEKRERGQVLRPGWGHYQLYGSRKMTGPKGYEDSGDHKTVRHAVDALPELATSGDPWCLFAGPTGPHDPFIVPERFAGKYDPADVQLPPSFRDRMADKPRIYQRQRQQYWDQLSEDEVRESIAHYWGYCTMMDEMFGEVLAALDATGQADNTLVIRTSDHGDYCAAHGLYCKGVGSFREAYHIPLAVRWPNGIDTAGREVSALTNVMDFAPTFLDLAGIETVPEGVAGQSLVPWLREETPENWRDTHYTQFNGVELYYTQRIVQTHTHKYVYNGFDFDELYDLEADPHEMVNLADQADYEEIKRDLVRRMWETALAEDDIITNPYATVAMAPWGPGIAV